LIGLVDEDQVGNFEQAGLFGLDLIAPAGVKNQHH
jgi:hypothetical protein